MNKVLMKVLKIVQAIFVSIATLFPSHAKAVYIYDYISNPFQVTYRVMTQLSETYWDTVEYSYNISMDVQARATHYLTKNSTVDDLISLKFSVNGFDFGVLDFIYPGHPPTPADYNPQIGGYLNIGNFDTNGLPTSWTLAVNQYSFHGGRGHFVDIATSNSIEHFGGYDEPFVSFDGVLVDQPGTWKVSLNSVPEPETFGLMLLGLGAVVVSSRHQNRRMNGVRT